MRRWRRSRRPDVGVEVHVRVHSIQARLPGGGADPSPVFGLRPGETRRIVIDGVPFEVTREGEDPA